MVTYSVASCVMLLKVNGANVLMLLLLRSLRGCKRTVSAHGQTNSRTLCIYACSASRPPALGRPRRSLCSRSNESYVHQRQLLQGCQLLGHRCQHVTLQVSARKRDSVNGTGYYMQRWDASTVEQLKKKKRNKKRSIGWRKKVTLGSRS